MTLEFSPREPVTLVPCGCSQAHYFRVERRSWMRLLPGRRLYRCNRCERLMLLADDIARAAKARSTAAASLPLDLDVPAYRRQGRASALRGFAEPQPAAPTDALAFPVISDHWRP